MTLLSSLSEEKGNGVSWIFIYCAEAHAEEEWPLSSSKASPTGEVIRLSQTSNTASRIQRTRYFLKLYPFLVESQRWTIAAAPPTLGTQSTFESLYNPWPLRIYGYQDGKLAFLSRPILGELDLPSFLSWLFP